MDLLSTLAREAFGTLSDLVPIAILFAIFQFGIIREPIAQLQRIVVGLIYVVIGLTLFRVGLTTSLVPVGSDMARQLVELATGAESPSWRSYVPLSIFAASIGFTATLIEPT